MNFLAHAHLSFNEPSILAGNMISDFVKGKKQFDYPLTIQKGIRLHRAIDDFTDSHDITRQLKIFFKPHYRLYSGAFADVVYDHFLANDKKQFASAAALQQFAAATYAALQINIAVLPASFREILPYMIQYDWLYHYRTREGIEKSFAGLVRRSAYLRESSRAFEIFNTHYGEMQSLYETFYPGLKTFAAHQLQQLLNT
jgi:acyl carrier protein phosphodiesterase